MSDGTEPSEAARTRVLVSTREVRVVFARDTTTSWGWSGRTDSNYSAFYNWTLFVPGVDTSRTISFMATRALNGMAERMTLDSLLARGASVLCWSRAGSGGCGTFSARAFERDGRVVLSITDSTTIRVLFGTRPSFVHAAFRRPGEPDRSPGDSVGVEYVTPQIPAPNAAHLAEPERVWRANEPPYTYRHVGHGPLVLTARDSVELDVTEMRCYGDVCSGTNFARPAYWTIDDPTVASVGLVPRDSVGPRTISARQPGRTTLRVALPVLVYVGPPDPNRPTTFTITREVVVTPR